MVTNHSSQHPNNYSTPINFFGCYTQTMKHTKSFICSVISLIRFKKKSFFFNQYHILISQIMLCELPIAKASGLKCHNNHSLNQNIKRITFSKAKILYLFETKQNQTYHGKNNN